jgi:hypothetical protein
MPLIRAPKPLESLPQVYAVLGENPGVKRITGASDQEISNWKRRGWAPSNTFLAIR